MVKYKERIQENNYIYRTLNGVDLNHLHHIAALRRALQAQ